MVGRVARREVGPDVAVALLHAQTVERPIPAHAEPLRSASDEQAVPDGGRPGARDIQLVAELAHVGDALRKRRRAADADVLAGAEWERLVREVSRRDCAHDCLGVGTPDADHGELVALLADRHVVLGAVGDALEPAAIRRHGARARNHAVAVLGEPGDGDVGDHATAMVEHLRVDDTADGLVQLGVARELQERARIGPVDNDLAKAR